MYIRVDRKKYILFKFVRDLSSYASIYFQHKKKIIDSAPEAFF